MKKIVKTALAWVLAVSLLLSLCACGRFVNDKDFDYVKSDIWRYVSGLSLSDFTEKVLQLQDEYTFSTDADAEKELRRHQLLYGNYKTETDLNGSENVKYFYTGKPTMGDAVYIYYEVAKTEKGECFAANLYGNSQPVDVGYTEFPEGWRNDTSKLFYLAEVSEALKNMEPAPRLTDRAVVKGDVVRISYQREWSDGTVDTTKAIHLRYDTLHSDMIDGLGDALVGKMPGDTFDYTVPTQKGGVDMDVTYHITVNWITEETFVTLPLAIPTDYFDEKEDGAALYATNGTTVYLRFFIENYLFAQVPAQNLVFYKSVIKGFTTDKTDAEADALHAEAVEAMKDQLDADTWDAVKTEMVSLLLEELQTKVKRIPLEEYDSYYDDIYRVEYNDYRTEVETAQGNGYTLPYKTFDEYIDFVTEGEYKSIVALASYLAERQIANRLLLFALAETAGLRLSADEYEKLYTENLEYAAEYYQMNAAEYLLLYAQSSIDASLYTKADGTVDEARARSLAEKELRWTVAYSHHWELVADYIFEHNTYVLPPEKP